MKTVKFVGLGLQQIDQNHKREIPWLLPPKFQWSTSKAKAKEVRLSCVL
jgi:hypothetical protein